MSKVPTAKEFLNGILGKNEYPTDAPYALIEFTKLHVTQALKQASENAKIEVIHHEHEDKDYYINEDSILNAYPLDNIK